MFLYFLALSLTVQVEAEDSSIFDVLRSSWRFRDGPSPGSCWIEFQVTSKASHDSKLKASYTSSLRPHTLVAEGLICSGWIEF